MDELSAPVTNPQFGRAGAGFLLGTLCAPRHVGSFRDVA